MEQSISIDIQNSEHYIKDFQQQTTNSMSIELVEVPLENNTIELKQHEKKKPKRIVYFSDGAVEEFSDDEEKPQTKSLSAKPSPSSWSSYIIESLDHMGEKLAWYFGITSPKYQYAIDEYWRRKREEEEEREFEAREAAAKMERRGRRNVAMEKEVSVVTVPNPSDKKLLDDETGEVTCKQPSSGVEMVRGGLVNEGFDDSLKY